MGTPYFAQVILEKLTTCENAHITAVICQPDKKAGRGQEMKSCHVKEWAEKKNTPVFFPSRLDDTFYDTFIALKPEVVIVAAYGKIVPQKYLDFPKLGFWNVHASLLPKYRGASPIAHAILHGEKETGVSLMKMEAGLDTGPTIAIEKIPLLLDDTCEILTQKLADLGSDLLFRWFSKIVFKDYQLSPQDNEKSSYAPKLKKEDGNINWNQSACSVVQQIHAFTPWPAAFTYFKEKRVIIETVVLDENIDENINDKMHHGSFLRIRKDGFSVACGDHTAVRILSLKVEGKKSMSSGQFVTGYRISENDRFEMFS